MRWIVSLMLLLFTLACAPGMLYAQSGRSRAEQGRNKSTRRHKDLRFEISDL